MLCIALLAALLATSCTTMNVDPRASAQPYVSVSQNQFYDDLAPYGRWIQLNQYGLVWQPWEVPYGWRPYSDGYWVYTDYGWTYQSDTPYGWAVYHYGRWAFDDQFGWVWAPGEEWGPAWVAWRYGEGYIGWAPLAPQVGWSIQGGFGAGNVNIEVGIVSFGWCFVNQQHFVDRQLRNRLEVPARNVTILRNSRNVTRYNVENNRIVNNSISADEAERFTRERVSRYNVSEARSHNEAGVSSTDNELRIYRPRVQQRPSNADVKRTYPNRTVVNTPKSRPARETPEQVQQRHRAESRQFNTQIENQRRQLDNTHQQQLNQPKAKEEKATIIRQQKVEEKAFNEHRSKETKVLEQRQRREEKEVTRNRQTESKREERRR